LTERMDDENDRNLNKSKDAKWYVVHTYSGHENKVKDNIEKMVENRGRVDEIYEVLVPTEEYVENKNGVKKVKERKLFPGYVLIKMNITDTSWYLVRNTRGVTGFVGPGSKPVPLSDREVAAFGVSTPVREEINLQEGDSIRVTAGPFESYVGAVQAVNPEKRKVKVYVSMFGRETLVELDYDDLTKV
jgi:transcriptional antiterminator NusG